LPGNHTPTSVEVGFLVFVSLDKVKQKTEGMGTSLLRQFLIGDRYGQNQLSNAEPGEEAKVCMMSHWENGILRMSPIEKW